MTHWKTIVERYGGPHILLWALLQDRFVEIQSRRQIAGLQISDRLNEMFGLLRSRSKRPEKVVSTAGASQPHEFAHNFRQTDYPPYARPVLRAKDAPVFETASQSTMPCYEDTSIPETTESLIEFILSPTFGPG